jgi:hypothetical protein
VGSISSVCCKSIPTAHHALLLSTVHDERSRVRLKPEFLVAAQFSALVKQVKSI